MPATDKCDLCDTPYKDWMDKQQLNSPYSTRQFTHVCSKCADELNKEVDRSRSYFLGLHRKHILDKMRCKLRNKKEAIKQNDPTASQVFPMKIVMYCLLYCVFTLILLFGTGGTLLLATGYMPAVVLLISISFWFLITKKLCFFIKETIRTVFSLAQDDAEDAVNHFTHLQVEMKNRKSQTVNPWD